MRFSVFVALRYFFSKNNRNAINIISAISVLAFMFTVAAAIIVLSAFNGFSGLVEMQISRISPDIKIEAAKGKSFEADSVNLSEFEEIEIVSQVLEENALLRAGERRKIAIVKGVDSNYVKLNRIDTMVFTGNYSLNDEFPLGVLAGYGVKMELGISSAFSDRLDIWMPNNKDINIHNPEASFNDTTAVLTGEISVDNKFDRNYILTRIDAVRALTGKSNAAVSALELRVKKNADIEDVKLAIREKLGASFSVKNKFEQNESIYKVMRSEKMVTGIILFFIILLASFSIVGSVSMLIIEKKENIFTLAAMGASFTDIRRIFLFSGLLIALGGGFAGIIIGGGISWLQDAYGFIKFPQGGSFIVSSYPVEIRAGDFLFVLLGIVLAGLISSSLPVLRMKKPVNNTGKT